MNLHQIASGLIGQVNPFIDGTIKVYSGENEDAAGKVSPNYVEKQVTGQLQPLAWKDLKHLDGMNITGVEKKFYVNGNFSAISRPGISGGDLLVIGSQVWMIRTVLELWPDWCSLGLTLQVT
ncbi:Uncharacterised protein [Yersinia massiliensis]|uniref:hypothetical protein n=1 Tax=Yersinia massiliensis TaxID=419257 RepID=UPI0005E01CEE|nr:hypothetical protein [Yersinia massiliensis]CNI67460.1 Uncharacterised protein [Yersinia massiliensis]